ncbi:arsenate reductase (glutaredoxin) [Diaphorobacter ruginosibacter]|uniref:arsenate reductase (glutaredoxin) n=1 Tax=Diaphorobacter ruginosibacter TaxID=1715720 RepID=UPI003342D402
MKKPSHTERFTIYHNTRCSNSRGALALLREHGIEPEIVDYIAKPLDAGQLQALIGLLGMPVREVIRAKEPVYKELGLDADDVSDAQLLEAIARYPVLLNRPIVASGKNALLCRPPEKVLDLLKR